MERKDIYLEDPGNFIPRLKALHRDMPVFVKRMMEWTADRTVELAIENLKGKVLSKRTGHLMSRLWKRVGELVGGELDAYVWTDSIAGVVHELGGTREYIIRPKDRGPREVLRKPASYRGKYPVEIKGSRRALKFKIGGKDIYRKWVIHPPAKKRPWLLPAGEQALKDGSRKMADELWRRTH